MTASGPFALGPALAGTSARRTAPRSAVAPAVPPPPSSSVSTTDAPPSRPSLKKEKAVEPPLEDISDDDQYSEQDDGVEIIDMENVRHMDWMAPETLHKERSQAGSKKLRQKRESPLIDLKGKTKGQTIRFQHDTS
jgi:DNA-directed RNA polymerase III subunit RPC4